MSIVKLETKKLSLSILLLLFVFYTAVLSGISLIRQIIGFFYFNFVPGFVFIKLLKLDELDSIEILLFSVGLSIAYLMLGGLLINELFFAFGILQPLSFTFLNIMLNIPVLVGGLLVCLKGKTVSLYKTDQLRFPLFALFFLVLPILGIIGTVLTNTYRNNVLLLIMIIIISLLFICVVFSQNSPLPKFYPFIILMIALALLYHSSLTSYYIVSFGSDVPVEYFVFKTTESNLCWNEIFSDLSFGRINDMLSVTILPTVYSILLNIASPWVFKIIFPWVFSLVPLGLYQIWRKSIGEKSAFISAFFFMAYETFYTEMLGLNRQMISELFLIILLIIILDKGKMRRSSKISCFIIFSFGLITSHYGVAEIFLFLISFALVSLFLAKKPNNKISLGMISLFFVVMFGWYIFTSNSVILNSILEYGDYVCHQLGDFFNPKTRETEVLRGLGLETPPTIWNAISRAFAYLTQFFIIMGFVGLITKRLKANYEKEYFIFTVQAIAFLIALIAIPGLANTMNMTRFYHVLLFFLAPLCIIGAKFIVKLVFRREKEVAVSALLVFVLVPYFLFQTSFVYEVARSESWSIPLSKYRMPAYRLYGRYGYIDACSVYGAQWLSESLNVGNSGLYADGSSRNYVLTIYGMVYRGYVNLLSNTTSVAKNGVVYLSTLNVIEGMIPFERFSWNTTELTFIFDDLSIVYANGGNIIYENTS